METLIEKLKITTEEKMRLANQDGGGLLSRNIRRIMKEETNHTSDNHTDYPHRDYSDHQEYSNGHTQHFDYPSGVN